MSFDYGSIDLGIKNPFKTEGKIIALQGIIQSIIGGYLLIEATVDTNIKIAWLLMLVGIVILGYGLKSVATGISGTLRYFVGRNHPTSLSQNFSSSEQLNSKEELDHVAYSSKEMEEMLIGRKNTSFVEPNGFLSRILYSFSKKLLFAPYPIRNLAQRLWQAWISTTVALVSFALVSFITLNGLAGEFGKFSYSLYSVILLLYILVVWGKCALPMTRKVEMHIESLGSLALAKIIAASLFLPILLSFAFTKLIINSKLSVSELENYLEKLPSINPELYMITALLCATLVTAIVVFMIKQRLSFINPVTEVSELRENWQESVHPKEIFINLENLVMANRRYKEAPNRVYKKLEPTLIAQVDGKGGFKGEMIQEIQPKYVDLDYNSTFKTTRFISLVISSALFVVATVLSYFFIKSLIPLIEVFQTLPSFSSKFIADEVFIFSIIGLFSTLIHFYLLRRLAVVFAKILSSASHLFYAEMQFESLLIYFKCEGTFTESKISTGTGIYDSTRSENTLVRSSITPWIIVTKIVSSTFAGSGMKNLEHSRYIMEMHKDDYQLNSIKEDIINFLKDRESIASITSERDLGNASQIHELNEQTRAIPTKTHQPELKHDAEVAGYIQNEEALITEGDTTEM